MSIDWNTGDKSGNVSIGTHSLYLSSFGPSRAPGTPIVLLMQGLGSTIAEWVAVQRLITLFARWVQYDRSGLGKSESPPDPPEAITAVSVATELASLLTNAGISGPFIIVCHSWGGMTAREFLHLRGEEVVGMVFVDANTEKSFDGGQWPLPFITSVIGDQDWFQTTGLTTSLVLSDEEWAAVKAMQTDSRHQATEAAESRGYKMDPPVLAAKMQFEKQVLGDRPISVVRGNATRDLKRMYDAGVTRGNGTEEERRLFREYLGRAGGKDKLWQEEILKLSKVGRLVRAENSGHNIQMQEPEVVAKEVKWVWELLGEVK